ncbi:cation transporter [Phormidium sp. FACHB-1136]|uniref:cation transporter n=1 Tax=Phormidium sp. FACHB-1136 TaxID=2692848 RepID=UPI00168791A0|nr:cation transporter [Phormidium sp. FACHB-1136]MBD2426307.1 cation transporter [Phormidium sp. FACHB-1136]
MGDCGCHVEAQTVAQRRVLVWLMAINAAMFVAEGLVGWWAQSTALTADALDMLADATVYGVSLYAVGRRQGHQRRAARLSGYFQISLAALVLADVLRRFWQGSDPQSTLMVIMGALALVANVICLALITRHRQGGIHMRASWIFSRNDVLANLGVILAAGLVVWWRSPLPDLIIGLGITLLVLWGGITILRESSATTPPEPSCPNRG